MSARRGRGGRVGDGLRRVRSVRVVNLPTPTQVGLSGDRPGALRPLARNFHRAPCTLCNSVCCEAKVCINVVDLTRLVLALGVAPRNLVVLDPDHVTELTRPAMVQGRAAHLILRRVSTEGLAQPACHMLARPGGELRCGVHGVRPGICRAYPFEWRTDRSDALFSIGLASLCPRHWALTPAARRQIEGAILTWRRENDAAERIVARWDRDHGDEPVERFFDFAVERAARILKMDARSYLAAQAPRLRLGPRLW